MSAPILLALRIGLTISLYMFLGWALHTLWKGLREQALALATRKTPPIILTVGGKPTEFNQPEITIGRDPHCEIVLENETVSALHARMTFHHGQWWLKDLGSTNGTLLNQEAVTTPTVIISGDMLGCGDTSISIQLGNDTVSPPTERHRMESS
ncbi:MAG: FHA domain-containing protein [Anaerolineales bacterium]|nr:FHA domain-containing protein [Anaerolineales bacterium]